MRFLVISDIHFVKSDEDGGDLDSELEWRFKEAVERASEARPFEAILVTGDIAFGGSPDEYVRATNFLRDVASRLQVPAEMIFVIPGNHDIDRAVTNKADQRSLRSGLRVASSPGLGDVALDAALKDRGDALMAPLSAFRDFADQFDCPTDANRPSWDRSLILDDRYEVALRGINSVLASHEHDNKKDEALVVGTVQALLAPLQAGIYVVLCHHPREWIRWPRGISTRLDRDASLQITGHTHDYKVTTTVRGAWLRAGALQPSRKEKRWDPHFAVVDIVVGDGVINFEIERWGWQKKFLAFARRSNETISGPMPEVEISTDRREQLKRQMATRRLTIRLAALAPAQILNAAEKLSIGLLLGTVEDAPGRLARLIVTAAALDDELLFRLWDEVNSIRDVILENPF